METNASAMTTMTTTKLVIVIKSTCKQRQSQRCDAYFVLTIGHDMDLGTMKKKINSNSFSATHETDEPNTNAKKNTTRRTNDCHRRCERTYKTALPVA